MQRAAPKTVKLPTIRLTGFKDASSYRTILIILLFIIPAVFMAFSLVSQASSALDIVSNQTEFFEEMRKRAVAVWTWTVDEEVIMRDMVQLGVQGVITNYPDRLNQVLADLEIEGAVVAPPGRYQRLQQTRWSRRRQIRKLSRSRRRG